MFTESVGCRIVINLVRQKVAFIYTKLVDNRFKDVLKKSALTLIIKTLGAGFTFAYNVILAQQLGARAVGVYFIAITITNILAVLGRMGLESSAMKYIAMNFPVNRDVVSSVYWRSLISVFIVSCILCIVVIVFSEIISVSIFNEPNLHQALFMLGVTIPALSLSELHGEILKSVKKPVEAIAVQSFILNFISLPLFLFLFKQNALYGALITRMICTYIVLVVSIFFWYKNTKAQKCKATSNRVANNELFGTGFQMLGLVFLNLVINWSDSLVLGIWRNSEHVGIYGICLKIAMLTSFVLVASNSIIAPKIASFYAKKDIASINFLVSKICVWIFLVSTPIFFVFIFFPHEILVFVGEKYIAGSTALSLLSIGQFINVVSGPVGYLLIMTGYQRLMLYTTLIAAILNLTLNISLVDKYGITGVALSTSFSIAFMNIVAIIIVYKKLRVLSIPFSSFIIHFFKLRIQL